MVQVKFMSSNGALTTSFINLVSGLFDIDMYIYDFKSENAFSKMENETKPSLSTKPWRAGLTLALKIHEVDDLNVSMRKIKRLMLFYCTTYGTLIKYIIKYLLTEKIAARDR